MGEDLHVEGKWRRDKPLLKRVGRGLLHPDTGEERVSLS